MVVDKKVPEKPIEEDKKPKTEIVDTHKIGLISIDKKEPEEKPEEKKPEEKEPKEPEEPKEIPKISVIVIDKKEPDTEEDRKAIIINKKNIIIKNLVKNIPKTTLVKYFNLWKYKPTNKEELDEIVKTKKKTLIKKRNN